MRIILCSLFLLAPVFAIAQDSSDRLKSIEDRLNKLEGAPAENSLSAFNPAMGIALDTVYHHTANKGNYLFRAAELNLGAPIDPFLKGWAILTGSPDGVEVEEAALETTALPYNLKIRGGRLFAALGRLAHFHDHELPVIDRPRSLDTFLDGETQGDGVEASLLLPTPFYLNATVGAFNKIGAENTRADNAVPRSLYEFTYLGRLNTYADLGDDHSIELGMNTAWTPKRFVTDGTGMEVRGNTWRTVHGADLTYRYHPTRGGLYRGIVWGTEVFQNDEQRFNLTTMMPRERVKAHSGFSHIQLKMGRHWRPGVLVDLTEDLDQPSQITRTYSGFLTYDLTEFQRLRFVYSYVTDNVPGNPRNNIVGLQWTGVLGYHVHGFRDR
ncbi:MAG: hypothetical protein HY399_01900 [Elusimicrobia bacterium]|nr:hypothetical protein [Elusimicrobiota bacterium]